MPHVPHRRNRYSRHEQSKSRSPYTRGGVLLRPFSSTTAIKPERFIETICLRGLDYLKSNKLHEAIVAASTFDCSVTRVAVPPMWKRAHRELRARLADGLRGDDADRFTHLDEAPGGEVAT